MSQPSTMNVKPTILVVDDQEIVRSMVVGMLEDAGCSLETAADALVALDLLHKRRFDLVITDLSLPGMDGYNLARQVRVSTPDTGVMVITGFPDEERLPELEDIGVDGYITKPFTAQQLQFATKRILVKRRAAPPQDALSDTLDKPDGFIDGCSEYARALRKRVRLIAGGSAPVLIEGETGTGKDVVAKAIHCGSARKAREMVVLNCAAIPKHLEESEFFGHAKGAFTGASAAKIGIVESAHQSTIFLDEIGELTPEVQAKLLRVLDTGEFRRVGETDVRKVDVRIISATNRDLGELSARGAFRRDLYFRLNGAYVKTLPLAQHPEDIPALVDAFLTQDNRGKSFTADALSLLARHSWPGNVRELRTTVRHLLDLSGGRERINSSLVRMILRIEEPPPGLMSFNAEKELFEKSLLRKTLIKHAGNVTRAAAELNVPRPSLSRKLKALGIRAGDFRKKLPQAQAT